VTGFAFIESHVETCDPRDGMRALDYRTGEDVMECCMKRNGVGQEASVKI
jgi:hypothetical protein